MRERSSACGRAHRLGGCASEKGLDRGPGRGGTWDGVTLEAVRLRGVGEQGRGPGKHCMTAAAPSTGAVTPVGLAM